MPVYKNNTVFEIARGIKAFLFLKVGVARGGIPNFEPEGERQRQKIEAQKRQIARLKKEFTQSGTVSWLDNASHDGVVLPPNNLRPCGRSFKDDEFYLTSAQREADRLVEHFGLTLDSCLLDVGSGPGRLAIGILERVGEIQKYRGIDVIEDYVLWGHHHITFGHPNFRFVHANVENSRYNPDGTQTDSTFTFPFVDEEFDIVTLYSVFTHMLAEGVRAYLKEFQRILRPDGRIFLTAFLEDGVPDVTENPEGYLGCEWKGALHCVRYNREFFEGLLDEYGFQLDRLASIGDEQGSDHTDKGQRGLYISKKGQ